MLVNSIFKAETELDQQQKLKLEKLAQIEQLKTNQQNVSNIK